MKENIIEFLRKKDYKFIRYIGQGGTGKTILLEDELINERFVCKKYSPYYIEHQETYFKNFVDEIKLLHLLYHPNVVRVFNYYLYPEKLTGYIIMEYIDGEDIYEYVKNNPDRLNDIFVQTIRGFRHLEENKILHRDIRPGNIMVTNDGIVKIIDFGFGKRIDFNSNFYNSVSINWNYTIPRDFETKTYNYKTEIYFIAKLFEEIIQINNLNAFPYMNILQEMLHVNPDERITSLFEIERKIIENEQSTMIFSNSETSIYLNFANAINGLYTKIEENSQYHKDIDYIITSLDNCYKNSVLEYTVQNPLSLTRCFIDGTYFYSKKVHVSVSYLKDFIQLLKTSSTDKTKVIINNLWQRLDAIPRYSPPDEGDLPF